MQQEPEANSPALFMPSEFPRRTLLGSSRPLGVTSPLAYAPVPDSPPGEKSVQQVLFVFSVYAHNTLRAVLASAGVSTP